MNIFFKPVIFNYLLLWTSSNPDVQLYTLMNILKPWCWTTHSYEHPQTLMSNYPLLCISSSPEISTTPLLWTLFKALIFYLSTPINTIFMPWYSAIHSYQHLLRAPIFTYPLLWTLFSPSPDISLSTPSILTNIFFTWTALHKTVDTGCHRKVVVAFSSLARIWGECLKIHSPSVLFFFFLKWRLACADLFHCLGQDQSTVAQRA